MSNLFTQGDVVLLKSGGVKMTVEQIAGDEISCVWFEGNKAQREIFPAAVLKKYVAPTVGVVMRRS